jgi:3-oxoacyl-[acyl-carrier-protein] synthase-1
MAAVFLNDLGIVCALGCGKAEVAARAMAGDTSGMVETDCYSPGRALRLGMVRRELPALVGPLQHRSRNNRLLLAALQQLRPAFEELRARLGSARIGVVIGTSTSGIAEAEEAIHHLGARGMLPPQFHYGQQELGSPALFLAEVLGVSGPAYSISTACSSSAKALASAARLLRAGLCDAVVAGGSDSLCGFTVGGFSALEAVSPDLSNAFSANRRGINLGEGCALFLVSREPADVRLLAVGESSDGYHISAPDPAGKGVRLAMERAIRQAGLRPADIDYVNLHGTGTPQNDAMEASCVNALFGERVPCSSTKPLTGHALGAAGAIEAGICYLALRGAHGDPWLPPHAWDGVCDPALPPIHLVAPGERPRRLEHVISNSFGFGGSNAVVTLGRG